MGFFDSDDPKSLFYVRKDVTSFVAPVITPAGGGASMFTKMFGSTTKKIIPVEGGISWMSAGAGALGGFGLASLFGGGGSKKDIAQEQQMQQQQAATIQPNIITYHAPYETYQPKYDIRTTNQYDYSTNIIKDSSMASITKKQAADLSGASPGTWETPQYYTQIPSIDQAQKGSQEQAATQTDGTNMLALAVIIAVGAIGYGYVSKEKKK